MYSQRAKHLQSLRVRKGLVRVGNESPNVKHRMEERLEKDEAGEVTKAQIEKGLNALWWN